MSPFFSHVVQRLLAYGLLGSALMLGIVMLAMSAASLWRTRHPVAARHRLAVRHAS